MLKCKKCKQRVRDTFSDKLLHIMKKHPEHVASALIQWPEVGRAIGEHIAQQTIHLVKSYAKTIGTR